MRDFHLENNSHWKGGINHDKGYKLLKIPDHPSSDVRGYVTEHRLIVEKILGKSLPGGAVIHHINEDRKDNRNNNLVVCESAGYHQTLHRRMRALRDCGHAHWLRCIYCKQYDSPENLYVHGPNSSVAIHYSCKRIRENLYYATNEKRRKSQSERGKERRQKDRKVKDWEESHNKYFSHEETLKTF